MKDIIKVATVNFHAEWGKKKKNLERMLGYIETAANAGNNLIVFPEMALTGYDDEADKTREEKMQYKEAEVIPGDSSNAVAELSSKYGIYVVFGMSERSAEDYDKIYNSACVCGPDGIIGAYRKIHLPYPEMHWANRGEDPFIFDTEWGPIGVSICYDTYCFPELMRFYAAKGCRMHINCTAYARCHGTFQAKSSLETSAAVNNIFITTSNLVGVDVVNDFWGGSSILGPGPGIMEAKYYAGYPFFDPAGIEHAMYEAVLDLSLATRDMFEPNPLVNNTTDYNPLIYKKLMEELLKDPKFTRKEFD